ncbi:unnamed protein product [Prorocentrum cordatum]|uniref:Alpha-N-acetylglucosaminidase n=1 Tax=Prorocentrum cordatum TaxID=2364126 RepID=A0ABN9W2J9_9DINO|nr:unnamed protein product [Polarella glacialis]
MAPAPRAHARGVLAVLATGAAAAAEAVGVRVLAGSDVGGALADVARRLLGAYTEEHSWVVALGNAPESRDLIPARELEALPSPDAFIVRSAGGKNGTVAACAGRTLRGTAFAFFELLQSLGFAFAHPLHAGGPRRLPEPLPQLDARQTPRWELRGTHYHTQHPLELTNLLNGFDAEAGTLSRARWEAALPAWEKFLDWMLALKQNYVEWMLLSDRRLSGGGSFELSDERQARLQELVRRAHGRGIEVGVDVPLALQQQHALSILPAPTGRWAEDEAMLTHRLSWLLACGFDHVGTELGTTEFTRGLPAEYMVRLLNATKRAIGPSRRLLVKNHCSTKQHADGFPDPRPGHGSADLNFNYLSYYAEPDIVAMPHTVQAYSLEDPAPTYGNRNFSDLRNWTAFLLQQGRPVVFYPETAYWVNYDISVPLFLAPVYAKSRVEDALDIDAMGGARPVLGQLSFESGWQWGYWLANSVQAAVAWERLPDTAATLHRVLRFMPSGVLEPLVELLVQQAEAQHRLLVRGLEGAEPPQGIGYGALTGIAYIQGSEGLSDLGSLGARYLGEGAPNPDRLRFGDLWRSTPLASLGLARAVVGDGVLGRLALAREALAGDSEAVKLRRQWYHTRLRPLLSDMNRTFTAFAERFGALPTLEPTASAPARALLQDLAVSARLLGLRCGQVLALYDHAARCGTSSDPSPPSLTAWCSARLAAARGALQEALALVPQREAEYGLEAAGLSQAAVSGWREPVPTAYSYGYLWAAHTLFYWRRDQAIVEQRIHDPCFATINDPVELGLQGGGGPWQHRVRRWIEAAASNPIWHLPLAGCAGPKGEPALVGADVSSAGTPTELPGERAWLRATDLLLL